MFKTYSFYFSGAKVGILFINTYYFVMYLNLFCIYMHQMLTDCFNRYDN